MCERCDSVGFIGLDSPAGLLRAYMPGEPEPGYLPCPECLDKGICPKCGSPTETPDQYDTRCTKCEWCWEDELCVDGKFEIKLAEAVKTGRVSW